MKDFSVLENALKLLSQGDAAKAGLLREIVGLWNSDVFEIRDGERQRQLRPEILRRLLGLVLTDDERAALHGLPAGCRMRENAKIISPDKFECGENVWIGEGAVLDASGGLTVGNHTSIGLNVMIWTHTSYLTNLTFANGPASDLIERKPTSIGSGCFIAGPSVVFHGVSIGDRSMVMPMSVVNKDVPPNSMVGGNPARVIKTIDDEFIKQRLEESRREGTASA